MRQRLVVITGGSGVGKSTLAQCLQEALLPEQWLHFSVDTLFYCLPGSVVRRVDQENDWSLVDSKAIVTAAHMCTRTLLDLGHNVIFDTVIASTVGASTLRSAFEEFDPMMVELRCSWDEIRRRTLARGDRTLEEVEHGYKQARGHLSPHHTFDSTSTSPEVIAAELKALVRSARGAA